MSPRCRTRRRPSGRRHRYRRRSPRCFHPIRHVPGQRTDTPPRARWRRRMQSGDVRASGALLVLTPATAMLTENSGPRGRARRVRRTRMETSANISRAQRTVVHWCRRHRCPSPRRLERYRRESDGERGRPLRPMPIDGRQISLHDDDERGRPRPKGGGRWSHPAQHLRAPDGGDDRALQLGHAAEVEAALGKAVSLAGYRDLLGGVSSASLTGRKASSGGKVVSPNGGSGAGELQPTAIAQLF